MKVLLHDCCAPCGAQVIQELQNSGHDVSVYFFNPNIYPEEEYLVRFEEMKKYCQKNDIPLIVKQYDHDAWLERVKGREKDKEGEERCRLCFLYRLSEVAQKAMEEGFEAFATTLTISPHKNAKVINEIGHELADFYNLKFIDTIWRKNEGFRKACKLCQKEGFHRQNYCGCEFSIRE